MIKPGPFQIFGPKSEIDIIYQALKVKHINGEPSVNCSKINIMPDLEMTIDGKTQKISSKDYTVQVRIKLRSYIYLFSQMTIRAICSLKFWIQTHQMESIG